MIEVPKFFIHAPKIKTHPASRGAFFTGTETRLGYNHATMMSLRCSPQFFSRQCFSRLRPLGLLGLILLLGLSAFTAQALTKPTVPPTTLSVDFAVPAPQKNMSGFLNGIGQNAPADDLVLPLKPAWWRLSANDQKGVQRARQWGAQIQLSVSDAYGYPLNHWRGHGAPWENNWKRWEAHVRQLANEYRGQPVYWDIWNEPDTQKWNETTFWNGSPQQFFETYKRAYTILREELGPDAIIGGPSYANYNQGDLEAFLSYCHENQLQVNFLSWHELMRVDFAVPDIAEHLAYIRKLASTYPDLRIQKIMINETVGPKTTYFPGDVLAVLHTLERGGADGANRACWNDSKKRNNCFNQSLDGLIDPETQLPRSAWWAYKTYADSMASRVKVSSTHPNVVGMASQQPAQILVGYFGKEPASSTMFTVRLTHLSAIGQTGKRLKVAIAKAPNTGEAPLSALIPVRTVTVPINKDAATVTIPDLQLHEEAVLTVLSP